MAQERGSGVSTPSEGERRQSFKWSRILLGVSVCVVALAVAWQRVYHANRCELRMRQKMQQDKMLMAALADVPGKRFLVTDVNPEVLRKNALLN